MDLSFGLGHKLVLGAIAAAMVWVIWGVVWQAYYIPELEDRLDRVTRELEETGNTLLFRDLEMPLVPVLTAMEERGIRLDVALLEQSYWLARVWPTLPPLLAENLDLAAGGLHVGEGEARADLDIVQRRVDRFLDLAVAQ